MDPLVLLLLSGCDDAKEPETADTQSSDSHTGTTTGSVTDEESTTSTDSSAAETGDTGTTPSTPAPCGTWSGIPEIGQRTWTWISTTNPLEDAMVQRVDAGEFDEATGEIKLTGPGSTAGGSSSADELFVRTQMLVCTEDGVSLVYDLKQLTQWGDNGASRFAITGTEGISCYNDMPLLVPAGLEVGIEWDGVCSGSLARHSSSSAGNNCEYTFSATGTDTVVLHGVSIEAIRVEVTWSTVEESVNCYAQLDTYWVADGYGIVAGGPYGGYGGLWDSYELIEIE